MRVRRIAGPIPLLGIIILTSTGCATGPRSFRGVADPSGSVRARAVDLGEKKPDRVAIPRLIGLLDDADPVVRMVAHESLKQRTGRDFGYVPWDGEKERAGALGEWKRWWSSQAGDL